MIAERTAAPRARILIICAHLRRDRRKRADRDFLQPLAGVHVGSCIDHAQHDVELYHEMWHGAYDTAGIVAGGYDLVFLSGLQQDFDRMRQLSYHFRRAGAKVVAGGNVCTMFPEFAARFFDAVCVGGVEAVYDVMTDFARGALQPIYHARPRAPGVFPVAYHLLAEAGIDVPFHLVEASRGCSFRCSFCIMPAEKNRFVAYGSPAVGNAIDRAIEFSPKGSLRRRWPMLWFMDNNFSDDRAYLERLCADLKADRRIKSWGALVTQNVLRDRELLTLMAQAKCQALFVGIESMDREFLKSMRKKQNLTKGQSVIDDVAFLEKLGIVVVYSQLIDPRTASLDDVRADLRATARDGRMPLPAFISFISPLAGTEFFWDCVADDQLRPNLRMRELDGETIAFRDTRHPVDSVVELARLAFTRTADLVPRHLVLFNIFRRIVRAGRLNPWLWIMTIAASWRIMQKASDYDADAARNYLGGCDRLDPQYDDFPADITPEDRERYFAPVLLTDAAGNLAAWLEPYRPQVSTARLAVAQAG